MPTPGSTAVLLAAVLPVLAACAGAPQPPQAAQDSQPVIATIIVKPRATATAEEVLHLAQRAVAPEAGVRYVRPMAGSAHILQLTGPAARDRTPALLERLQATGAFEYVEIDSLMKAR